MITSVAPRSRMGRATFGSLAFHGLVALCIPALAWTATSSPEIETVTFTKVQHIQIEPPKRLPQPKPMAVYFSVKPHVTLVVARVEISRSSPRHSASPPPTTENAISSAPTVANNSVIGNGTTAGEAAPQATATPAQRNVASTGGHTGGMLPFGAEQPDPVLDPDVMRQLQGLGVHVTLVVTVGDDGKTKRIAFDPNVDAATQAHIESLLADASWDPAVCGGGINCEGLATIKL